MAFRLGTKRVYFPNLILTLVRSNLPPNQAVFRVEPHVNKLDVRDYLWHVYGVRILDVRTAVFLGRERTHITKSGIPRVKRDPTWKKVIVTLADEFNFPEPPNVEDDFGGKEAKAYRERLRARTRGWKNRMSSTPESNEAIPIDDKTATATTTSTSTRTVA
ncbi:hypothetical protein BDF19DRAFT_467169 [Syncephalis fuscata]|nr:hypothetical protein BDF19DRAFT_467169 [Syncephalis fuscata]